MKKPPTDLTKQWARLCGRTGIPGFNERYSNAAHLHRVFSADSNARTELGYALHPQTTVADATHALEILRYILVRTVAMRNPIALRQLMAPECDKQMALHALVYFCNLLHGMYLLKRVASGSDFDGVLRRGAFADNAMLSFHMVHYLYHTGEKLQDNREAQDDAHEQYWDNLTSLTCHSAIYTAEKVQETRNFSEQLIVEQEQIFASGYFDVDLLELYCAMNACIAERFGNSANETLHTHLQAWLFFDFKAPPIYMQHILQLLNR